jgi:hypothetical protein
MSTDSAPISAEELARRKAAIKDTLRCPYCEGELTEWEVGDHLYCDWNTDRLHVCFNDECPYFTGSWRTLASQGSVGGSYRLVFDPVRNWCGPVVAHRPRSAQK